MLLTDYKIVFKVKTAWFSGDSGSQNKWALSFDILSLFLKYI